MNTIAATARINRQEAYRRRVAAFGLPALLAPYEASVPAPVPSRELSRRLEAARTVN
jgi:hypothetical protein